MATTKLFDDVLQTAGGATPAANPGAAAGAAPGATPGTTPAATTAPTTAPAKPSAAEIKGFLDANITKPGAIGDAMKKYGVGFDDIKAAGSYTNQQVSDWMNQYGNAELKSQWDSYLNPRVATPPVNAQPPQAEATPTADNADSIMGRLQRSASAQVSSSSPTPAAAAPAYTRPGSAVGQASQTQWDEANSTAGRLQTMLDSNSPLMQRAAARAAQAANRRGVLNSTMAAQSGQRAMIDAATPIAQTDASLFSQTARENTAQRNAWDVSSLDRNLRYDELAQQESQFGRNLSEQGRQANLSASTQLTVAGMNYDINDRRMGQEDRQFLAQFGLEQSKLNAQIDQFAKEFGLSAQELELRKDQLSQEDRQFYDQLNLEKSKLDQQADQFNREWENKFSLESMAQQNRIDLATIDANNRKELMAIEAQYKQDIAGNENISNAWGLMMQEVGKINANPDMDAGTKATNIGNIIGGFKNFTGFWKKVSGGTIDVSDLLDFEMDLPTEDAEAGREGGVPVEAPGGE